MSGMSFMCDGIYRFIIISGVSGLLEIFMACRYGDMLLGVGILVTLSVEYMSLCNMASTPPFGISGAVNCWFLRGCEVFVWLYMIL